MAICSSHLFHQACLVQLAKFKSSPFLSRAPFIEIQRPQDLDSRYKHFNQRYKFNIPEKYFPCCPSCRTFPADSNCKLEIVHIPASSVSLTIEGKPKAVDEDKQYLFENIYAIYNTAQAALSYLQTYPELAVAYSKSKKSSSLPILSGME